MKKIKRKRISIIQNQILKQRKKRGENNKMSKKERKGRIKAK
jgi:hypothetical protein